MKKEEKLTVYDSTDYYREQVEPLIKKLKTVCEQGMVPFYVTCAVKNDESGTEYKSDGHLCGSGGYHLKDDQLTKHLSIELGFVTLPRDTMEDIDINDFLFEAE